MTTTLVCHATPWLRIYDPATGGYASFVAGKLEIDPDDPAYEVVMAEAVRNPSIQVVTKTVSCTLCGEDFGDAKTAKARLEKHVKDVHFDVWKAAKDDEYAAEMTRELKAREGFVCDVCRPVQTFGDEDTLALHVSLLHTAPPPMDSEGNSLGGDEPAVSSTATTIPAAKSK